MSPKNKNRDYEKEAKWAATREQKTRRAQRNQARREAIREGRAAKGDGKEVHHENAPRRGSLEGSKVRVVSKKTNRSIQPKRGK